LDPYEKFIPDVINQEVIIAISLMIIGVITVYLLEKFSQKKIVTL
jgi:hypothetical protein